MENCKHSYSLYSSLFGDASVTPLFSTSAPVRLSCMSQTQWAEKREATKGVGGDEHSEEELAQCAKEQERMKEWETKKGKGGDENTVIASILLIPRGQQSRKEEEDPE